VTLLIKGIQDKSRLARKELSNKEIKAQELISKGYKKKKKKKYFFKKKKKKKKKKNPPHRRFVS